MSSSDLNLADCAKEPIHIPGSIQPHGLLFAFSEREHFVTHASDNVEQVLTRPIQEIVGKRLENTLDPKCIAQVVGALATRDLAAENPLFLELPLENRLTVWDAILHRNSQGLVILELEPSSRAQAVSLSSFYALVKRSIVQLRALKTREAIMAFVVEEIKRISGFERVKLYQFDSQWHGTVVAEAREADMESYLNHRFPESDIPEQARRLYSLNWTRLITNVNAVNARILGLPSREGNAEPLDLTFSTLRSVSPVHIEYLKNMGVSASMSVSVMRGDKLWGLISCHQGAPKQVPFEARLACEFLAQAFSHELANLEERTSLDYRKELKAVQEKLAGRIIEEGLVAALLNGRPNAMDLLKADGIALIVDHSIHTAGFTPTTEQLIELSSWLKQRLPFDTYSTDELSSVFSAAAPYAGIASGLLALPLSREGRSYLLAFRREMIQTLTWGGDPSRKVTFADNALHPRKSFETYKETVRGRSRAWDPNETGAALDLREVVIFEELVSLNRKLEEKNRDLESFAYVASHDLKEPLRTITSFLNLLERKYRTHLDDEGKEYVNFVMAGAKRMSSLIDKLMGLANASNAKLHFKPVRSSEIVQAAIANLQTKLRDAGGDVTIASELPVISADPVLMVQVFQNLISNAITYRGKEAPRIVINALQTGSECRFDVKDNGVGIAKEDQGRIFEVFRRLHTQETPGSGLGLAICKRIIERHGGRIWVESQIDEGSTFKFTLKC